MKISLIVAMDKKRGIGFQNSLPWAGKIPRDMARFKELTISRPVIMGRRTFESIGRPLPKRLNIVLTRDKNWQTRGVKIAHTLNDALTLASADQNGEVFIIGGTQIFREALPLANRLYITEIDGEFACDTFFPEYDISAWVRMSMQIYQADERNRFTLRFLNFLKKQTA